MTTDIMPEIQKIQEDINKLDETKERFQKDLDALQKRLFLIPTIKAGDKLRVIDSIYSYPTKFGNGKEFTAQWDSYWSHDNTEYFNPYKNIKNNGSYCTRFQKIDKFSITPLFKKGDKVRRNKLAKELGLCVSYDIIYTVVKDAYRFDENNIDSEQVIDVEFNGNISERLTTKYWERVPEFIPTFRKGDWVKVVSEVYVNNKLWPVGTEFKVKDNSYYVKSHDCEYLMPTGENRTNGYDVNYFVKIDKPTSTFKKGDRVKAKYEQPDKTIFPCGFNLGDEFVLDKDSVWFGESESLQLPERHGYHWVSRFEKIPQIHEMKIGESKQKFDVFVPTFKKGDLVRRNNKYNCAAGITDKTVYKVVKDSYLSNKIELVDCVKPDGAAYYNCLVEYMEIIPFEPKFKKNQFILVKTADNRIFPTSAQRDSFLLNGEEVVIDVSGYTRKASDCKLLKVVE